MSEVIIGSPLINQVVIQEEENTVAVQSATSTITTIVAQGPQGPRGEQGTAGSGIAVDDAAKVDKSVVYYDLATASFKADATWIISSITDGGNF
jgi:hypothetical protein